MNAFRRGKSGHHSIYVPQRTGRLQRSTGTSNPVLVRAMKKMVKQLKDERRWTVLESVRKERTLGQLYDALAPIPYTEQRASALEAELSSVNLVNHIAPWIKWVLTHTRNPRTAVTYKQQVETLVKGDKFLASQLTRKAVMEWLGQLTCSSGTKRKYLYGLRSFVNYLLDAGLIQSDPIAHLKAPPKGRARMRWVTQEVDEAICGMASTQYSAFFAFIKGTGADVGSALRAQWSDVNLKTGRVRIRGTKTDSREVHEGTIEKWALPFLFEHHHPGEMVFRGLTRFGAQKHHTRICELLKIKDYTLKDARHSVAVRMRLRGCSFEEIAAQLGNSVQQTVSVYARFKPAVGETEKAPRAAEAIPKVGAVDDRSDNMRAD